MDKVLLDKVLEMPPSERVAFAELVLATIDKEDEDIRQAWILEVKERMNAVHEGTADLLDFDLLYHEDQDS